MEKEVCLSCLINHNMQVNFRLYRWKTNHLSHKTVFIST